MHRCHWAAAPASTCSAPGPAPGTEAPSPEHHSQPSSAVLPSRPLSRWPISPFWPTSFKSLVRYWIVTCLIISRCRLARVEVCSFRLLNWVRDRVRQHYWFGQYSKSTQWTPSQSVFLTYKSNSPCVGNRMLSDIEMSVESASHQGNQLSAQPPASCPDKPQFAKFPCNWLDRIWLLFNCQPFALSVWESSRSLDLASSQTSSRRKELYSTKKLNYWIKWPTLHSWSENNKNLPTRSEQILQKWRDNIEVIGLILCNGTQAYKFWANFFIVVFEQFSLNCFWWFHLNLYLTDILNHLEFFFIVWKILS